jgi:hypothetical protein
MSTIAVVNAVNCAPAALLPLADGSTSLQRALDFGRDLPEVCGLVLLLSRDYDAPPGVRKDIRVEWSEIGRAHV